MEKKMELALAKDYNPEKHKVSNWIISEKYDGIRAYWNGKELYSRNGNIIHAPDFFKSVLPKDVCLDGELWAGRKNFEAMGIVRHIVPDPTLWKKIQYIVFDLPGPKPDKVNILPYKDRLKLSHEIIESIDVPFISSVHTFVLKDPKDIQKILEDYEKKGAEGIILRDPNSPYISGRSSSILKVKSRYDAEGIVVGFKEGKGKYKNLIGSIELESTVNDKKIILYVSGFTDDLRRPGAIPLGAVVTYKYTELTKNGIPRFPAFWRFRPPE